MGISHHALESRSPSSPSISASPLLYPPLKENPPKLIENKTEQTNHLTPLSFPSLDTSSLVLVALRAAQL